MKIVKFRSWKALKSHKRVKSSIEPCSALSRILFWSNIIKVVHCLDPKNFSQSLHSLVKTEHRPSTASPSRKDQVLIFSQYGPEKETQLKKIFVDWSGQQKRVKQNGIVDSDQSHTGCVSLKRIFMLFSKPTKVKLDFPASRHFFFWMALQCIHSGQYPVQYLENIGPAMEQSDWLILVTGRLATLIHVKVARNGLDIPILGITLQRHQWCWRITFSTHLCRF